MPIIPRETYTRHPPISLRAWKNKQIKTLTFQDEGKDIPNTPNGLMHLCLVSTPKGETKELWIRPNSALYIGLSNHAPLTGKTLKITKTTGITLKDTRYNAEEA